MLNPVLTSSSNDSHSSTIYAFDRPVSVLGCASRWQFCDAAKQNCTSLTGFTSAHATASRIWSSTTQQKSFEVWKAAYWDLSSGFEGMIDNLGISLLTARNTLNSGLQGSLPSNQWQREILHWYQTSMTKIERTLIELATGPSDSSVGSLVQQPLGTAARELCHSQVSHSFTM